MVSRERWRITSAIPIACILSAALTALAQHPSTGSPLRWSVLRSPHDGRDPEMMEFDIRMDERLVETLNNSVVFAGRLRASVTDIDTLLEDRSAFASLHFDPTRTLQLSPEEENALVEFMARGGFLLVVQNNYAYMPRFYRQPARDTLFNFLATELPKRDPEFRAERLELTHPIFQGPYEINVPPPIAREMEQDSYVGETAFFYEDRMVGYTYALYGFESNEGFAPLRRPFRVFTLMDAGYRMLENIYHYALSH